MEKTKSIYQRENRLEELPNNNRTYNDMYFAELVRIAKTDPKMHTRVSFLINNNMDNEAIEILEKYRRTEDSRFCGECRPSTD